MALTTSAFADNIKQYILTKISYPIIVNGTEYKNSALPALNYEGTTYLPLKAIGDVLGEPVKWNPELKRVEVGESVAAATPPPPQRMAGYRSVIKMNGEIYGLQDPISISVDEKQKYYFNSSSGLAIKTFISIDNHEFEILT